MKQKHYSRQFLNKKQGTALIEVSCSIGDGYVDADVTLSDCSRQIHLDFSFSTDKSKKEKIEKLSLIIQELQTLETILKECELC